MADPAGLTIDILRADDGWSQENRLRALAERVLGAALDLVAPALPQGCELSLVFTGDEEIAALNAQWRGKSGPTNVLSFPVMQIAPGDAPPPMLGDIVLAYQTVEREARDEDKTFEAHLSHLLVHGLLHLLGHDHETPDEAQIMEDLERQILARLGLPDPYT